MPTKRGFDATIYPKAAERSQPFTAERSQPFTMEGHPSGRMVTLPPNGAACGFGAALVTLRNIQHLVFHWCATQLLPDTSATMLGTFLPAELKSQVTAL